MNQFVSFYRKNVKPSSVLIILLIFCIPFSACKKEQETENQVRFNLQVVDDLGNTIYGTKIYIFGSQSDFENALASGIYSTAIDSAVSIAPGGATFLLKGDTEYWIFTRYFDSGRGFTLINSGNGKIEKLEKNSELNVKLFIAPVTGNVSFWSRSVNKFPIEITFDGAPQPQMFNPLPTAPTAPNNTAAVNVSRVAGTYSYKATASNGCVWTGSTTITRGGFQAIELTPCVRGRVTFTNSSFDVTHGDIQVVLDNNDLLGKLNGSGSYFCASPSSSGPGTAINSHITATRDKNKYTYIAKSSDNQCTWMGDFEIKSDTCIVIDLPPCGATF